MTPLAEDRKQIGWRFPRVCQQELEPVGGRGLLGRQAVAAVVIFYQHPKQVHQLVFSRGPAALAEQIAKARTDQIVLLVILNACRHGLSEQLFVGSGWHQRFSRSDSSWVSTSSMRRACFSEFTTAITRCLFPPMSKIAFPVFRPRSVAGKVCLRAGKCGQSAPRAISRSRCNGLRAAAYLGAAVKAEAEAGTHYPFIEFRNSALLRVLPSLSSSSSMVSTGESGLSTRRRMNTRLSSSLGMSNSSLRVPLLLMSMAGKTRLSTSLRSRWISRLPVPLNSSKMTSSMRLPVSMSEVAMMVSEPPSSMLRAAPKKRLGRCRALESTPPESTLPEGGTMVL